MKIQFNKDKKTIFLSVISGLVCLLLVTSMLIQFKTVDKSKEEDLESLRSDELKTQISAYKSKYEETMGQYNENKNKKVYIWHDIIFSSSSYPYFWKQHSCKSNHISSCNNSNK